MSWFADFTFAILYPELLPPAEWRVNTLSEIDLTGKLEWCKVKNIEITDRLDKLHGDEYILAKELLEWLDYQIALLQHWLETLPAGAVVLK